MATSRIPSVIERHEGDLLAEWVRLQTSAPGYRRDRVREEDLAEQSRKFIRLLTETLRGGGSTEVGTPAWSGMREFLSELSLARARQGFSPGDTVNFILSFKQPLFARLRAESGTDMETLADEIWGATLLLDQLGLHTAEVHQKGREEVIRRQEREMMELSTPVVQLWSGILALPVIGTLDSGRAQVVMENLLQKIVETGASYAIIDITGVPTVDTLVAQHLLKTISAARLMGAECIVSGIRPQIAQTIVHLGVELHGVVTKSTLADAFAIALSGTGLAVCEKERLAAASAPRPAES